jgi:hypothetical protein
VFDKWIFSHPRRVGETYAAHAVAALRFAGELLAAASVCAVHALIPGLFERTASRMVTRLSARMSARSQNLAGSPAGAERPPAGFAAGM